MHATRKGGGGFGVILAVIACAVIAAHNATPGPPASHDTSITSHISGLPATSATCRALIAGIRQQESGGNYQAVNASSGALGAYQVMPSNVPAWSTEILGHPVSRSQWLASPQIQDKVAGGKLNIYCHQYGPRGAAAAWYSGRPERENDPTPVHGGPSVKHYVDNVMALAGL